MYNDNLLQDLVIKILLTRTCRINFKKSIINAKYTCIYAEFLKSHNTSTKEKWSDFFQRYDDFPDNLYICRHNKKGRLVIDKRTKQWKNEDDGGKQDNYT